MEPSAPAVLASLAATCRERDKGKYFLQGLVTSGLCDAEDVAEQIGTTEQCAAHAFLPPVTSITPSFCVIHTKRRGYTGIASLFWLLRKPAEALILCSCHVILSKSGYIFVNVNLLQCEKKSQRRESSQPNYICTGIEI